jgi:hypothetical protein
MIGKSKSKQSVQIRIFVYKVIQININSIAT